jgi:dipeptidyl-peptidase-3
MILDLRLTIYSVQKNSSTDFVLLVASAEVKPDSSSTVDFSLKDGNIAKLTVQYGDCAPALKRVVAALVEVCNHIFHRKVQAVTRLLPQAKKYATDDTPQTAMLEKYIDSFNTGSIEDHKAGSTHWVKDVGPVVESYIGFIETYVDPYGGRAEWEGAFYRLGRCWRFFRYLSAGFTAIVNKELSAKYEKLVNDAPELIKGLPWGKDFEVDVFKKPDFTALEVLTFATGGKF